MRTLTIIATLMAGAILIVAGLLRLGTWMKYMPEPVVTGFMRTRPGKTFWAWFYSLLYFLQVGWPAWAASIISCNSMR